MLRVVIAGWYPPDIDQIAGGPHYNAFMQAQTLRERDDIQVEVVSRHRGIRDPLEIDSNGVRVHFVPEPRQRVVPRQYTMPAKVAPVIAAVGPDIVVAHNSTEALAAVAAGVPTVYVVHGIPKHELRFARGMEWVSRFLQARTETKALRAVRDVVCISDYCIRACREDTGSTLHKISYPIVEDAFFQVPEYVDGRGVVFAGVINPMKNVGCLISAWRRVALEYPDAVLYVCGRSGDDAYEQMIEAQVGEWGLAESVRFMGVLSRAEIAGLLEHSVCLALPSRQEDTPNVVAQSLSAGRPAVATTVGGVPEMVAHGRTGFLFDPDDADGFAEAIVGLMGDPERVRAMGSEARAHALKTFERHAHVEQLLEICGKALASGSLRGERANAG